MFVRFKCTHLWKDMSAYMRTYVPDHTTSVGMETSGRIVDAGHMLSTPQSLGNSTAARPTADTQVTT